jgi:hypothetical protein
MAQQLETALTKHKRPHLARLLEAAKYGTRGPLKRYLEAGGTPDAVVLLEQPDSPTKQSTSAAFSSSEPQS